MGTIPLDYSRSSLSRQAVADKASHLSALWELVDNQKLRRIFTFSDFKAAVAFVNDVARVAEQADHHPDIHIHYNKVIIELWTHLVSGLTDKDFSLATKIETIAPQ